MTLCGKMEKWEEGGVLLRVYFFFLLVWILAVKPCSAQGLHLALTQGSLLEGSGTIWDATDLIQVNFVQDVCLRHCTIASALNVYISGLLHYRLDSSDPELTSNTSQDHEKLADSTTCTVVPFSKSRTLQLSFSSANH